MIVEMGGIIDERSFDNRYARHQHWLKSMAYYDTSDNDEINFNHMIVVFVNLCKILNEESCDQPALRA